MRWEILFAALVVFFARCVWIDQYGPSLPSWDEWGEIERLAHRGVGSCPSLQELAAPHAEHRILWQRLIAQGLVLWNGEWDSQLRNVANAAIASLYAAMLAGVLSAGFSGTRKQLLFWPSVALTALPMAAENLLFAFQTSFHLQMFLSLAAFAGVAGRSFRDVRWWLGLLAGLASVFNLGSGFFPGPVLLVWAGLWIWREKGPLAGRLRAAAPTLVAASLITGLGLAMIYRPSGADGMAAQNAGEFMTGLLKHLAWPWVDLPWAGPLLWSPLVVLAWRYLRSPVAGAWESTARMALCVGGWVLLNLFAMAVFRGASGVGPVTRYYDFHTLGMVANAAALVLVATGGAKEARKWSWPARGWASFWIVAATWGAGLLLADNFREDLPDKKGFSDLQAANVFQALVHKDRTVMVPTLTRFHAPHPEPGALQEVLDDPKVVALLPARFRVDLSQTGPPAKCEGCFVNPRLPRGLVLPPGEIMLASSYQEEGALRGRFLSAPIRATGRWLRFQYLGKETGGSLSLRLVAEGGGKAFKIINDRRNGTGGWWPITVRVVKGVTYRLEFIDDSDNAWGAVTLPVPEAPISHRANILCSHALGLLLGTTGCWIALAAAAGLGRRHDREPGKPTP